MARLTIWATAVWVRTRLAKRAGGLALLALPALLAACVPTSRIGGVGGTRPGPCPETIEISGFAFHPPRCSVAPGTALTFVNRDTVTHSATAASGAANPFDTGIIAPGGSATVTFGAPGDYPYFCLFHPGMRAIITVNGSQGDPAVAGNSGGG